MNEVSLFHNNLFGMDCFVIKTVITKYLKHNVQKFCITSEQ
jgi:hypothetical protein